MAVRLLTATLRRYELELEGKNFWRLISSRASPIDVVDIDNDNDSDNDNETLRKCTNDKKKTGRLRNEIMRLKFQGRSESASTTMVLQNWVDKGHKVKISHLRNISTQLVKFKRYNHALEILTWMETRPNFRMSAEDHAMRVELIIKVRGVREAEEYFAHVLDSASRKVAALPLLHGYVKERDTRKAEALMMNMNERGLLVSPHPFNEMMKLYMATSQYEKVHLVIQEMKQNKIPRNFLSYNLWMSASGEVSEVAEVEMVYKEMVDDENVEVGWSTLSTLANVYAKQGLVGKALWALKNAEKKLSTINHLGYFFLITQYSSLKNKDGVLRIWKASKAVDGRITCANYMCILSSLVKVGDLVEAERVFREWESNCRKYDIRVSNVLLGAYVRNGLMGKAEALHLHTLERGGCPNYKTWEILMEGWVKSQNMDKAINALKKGFVALKHCDWRPSHGILMAIAEFFEKHGKFEDANYYIRVIHHLGLASLPLYKLILRVHLHARRPAFDILKMMEKDKIEMDDETSAFVQALYLYT